MRPNLQRTKNLPSHYTWLPALILAILVFAFYAINAFSLGFIYDDREQILADDSVLNTSGLYEIFTRPHFSNNSYYRPVSRLFLKLQLTIFGKSAPAIHLANCLLAAGIAFMLFMLAGKTTTIHPTLLFSAVLCTALHPVVSSCVYMISGQEALLATLLVITAICLYEQQKTLLACIVSFAAMLSRENAMAIPAFLTLVYFTRPECDSSSQRKVWPWRLTSMWLTALIYLFLRNLILADSVAKNMIFQPTQPVTAYLYLLQSILIPEPELVYEPSESVWASTSTLLAVVMASMALYRGRHSLKQCQARYWLIWVFIMFLPTSNLLLQQTPYDERHNLIALPGFTGLLLAFSGNLFNRQRKFSLLIVFLLALLLGSISHNRAQYFASEFNFATQWIKTDPGAGEPYAILGHLLQEKGQPEAAQKMFEQAIRFRPTMASAYDNLGSLFGNAGNHKQAALFFKQSVGLDSGNPTYRYNLAMALLNNQQYIESLIQLHLAQMYTASSHDPAVEINSGFFQAWAGFFSWRFQLTNPIF